jgi:hypothetical protein
MTNTDDEALFAAAFQGYEESLRRQCNVPDDWSYVSLPFMGVEFFQEMVEIVGEENMRMVSGIQANNLVRASLFVSPDGHQRLTNFVESQEQLHSEP